MQSNIMTVFPYLFRLMHRQLFCFGFLFSILSVPVVHAAPPEFSLPIDCKIGETCWLVNFVDHDPGPGRQDFRCGNLSYNTHKGTDIAIMNDAAMQAGVSVLAAAPGRVIQKRDDVPYSTQRILESSYALKGKECGNKLIIDHGDGYTTQYCHLKAGSLNFTIGDTVRRGDILGLVGRSGRTSFPHIHMQVQKGTSYIDPFTGRSNVSPCSPNEQTGGLWSNAAQSALKYPGPQPYHLGFATSIPEIADIRSGKLNETVFKPSSPALVFWVEVFSMRAGDRMVLSLIGPSKEIIKDQAFAADQSHIQVVSYIRAKPRGPIWDIGVYKAHVSITRGDQTISKSATAYIR